MKVISAQLVESNKRERISGGVYIEFDSIDTVNKDDYFAIKIGNSIYDFKAKEIKVEGNILKISAVEVGYWASKLDHKKIDLRTVIVCDVIPVNDEEEIKNIYTRSCWC